MFNTTAQNTLIHVAILFVIDKADDIDLVTINIAYRLLFWQLET